MISTMKLQEKLSDNFNSHEIVVNESYSHVQRNGVLKVDFDHQIGELQKDLKRVEKMVQNVASRKDKNKNTTNTPP